MCQPAFVVAFHSNAAFHSNSKFSIISQLQSPCRSVVGLSIDFQVLNLLGFACYAAYNVALFFVPVVQKQYKDAFQSQHIPVGLEDVLFSVHAFVITALTLIQCCVYERGNQRFNTIYGQLSAVVAIVAVAGFGLVALLQSQSHPVAHLTWIHFLLALSSVKLVVSLIKYIPQVRIPCILSD